MAYFSEYQSNHKVSLPYAAIAVSAALLIHGSVLYAFTEKPLELAGDAQAKGKGGIEIGLGQIGSHANVQERLSVLNTKPEKTKPKSVKKIVEKPLENKALISSKKNPIKSTALNKNSVQVRKKEERENAKPIPKPPTAATSVAAVKGTGKAEQIKSGGKQGTAKSYINEINRWLAKYQRYPSTAKKEKQEGTVRLTFTIDRQGNVLNHAIKTSSGFPLLDQAALKMIVEASPLPSMPNNLFPKKESITLVKPIDFKLITNASYKD
jgi:protein TonB